MASFPWGNPGPAGQPRRAASVAMEEMLCVESASKPEEGPAQLQAARLEVDLSRGEQGKGQERVGAEVHTLPWLVCC